MSGPKFVGSRYCVTLQVLLYLGPRQFSRNISRIMKIIFLLSILVASAQGAVTFVPSLKDYTWRSHTLFTNSATNLPTCDDCCDDRVRRDVGTWVFSKFCLHTRHNLTRPLLSTVSAPAVLLSFTQQSETWISGFSLHPDQVFWCAVLLFLSMFEWLDCFQKPGICFWCEVYGTQVDSICAVVQTDAKIGQMTNFWICMSFETNCRDIVRWHSPTSCAALE